LEIWQLFGSPGTSVPAAISCKELVPFNGRLDIETLIPSCASLPSRFLSLIHAYTHLFVRVPADFLPEIEIEAHSTKRPIERSYGQRRVVFVDWNSPKYTKNQAKKWQ
jgi:hypothetical protein